MTAIELLQATRNDMGMNGSGIGSTIYSVWIASRGAFDHTPVSSWNEACRALVAYIDPYAESVSNCRLYGYIRTFERQASFHTQIDAIDYAIDYLGGIHSQLDSIIDPRD